MKKNHRFSLPSFVFALVIVLVQAVLSGAGRSYASGPGAQLASARQDSPKAPPSCTKPKFGPAAGYPAGQNPYSIASGDFNEDGFADLAAGNRETDDVSVLLSDGAGGFTPTMNFPAGDQPRDIEVGDLNGDGNLDLAIANLAPFSATVLLGDGAGNFGPPTSYGSAGALTLAVGDYNGDSFLDMAVGAGNIAVFLGDGAGNFTGPIISTVGKFPWGVDAGDLNGDGILDLVTAAVNNDAVSVLMGIGDGTFGPPADITLVDAVSVALGDFNRDGDLDAAVAQYIGVPGPKVAVLIGTGSGTFNPPLTYTVGNHPFSVGIFDFNGDGKEDLVTANEGGNNVSVLKGRGNGQFDPAVHFGAGTAPVAVASGDFNGDGRQDLATADRLYVGLGSNDVRVLLNTCGQ